MIVRRPASLIDPQQGARPRQERRESLADTIRPLNSKPAVLLSTQLSGSSTAARMLNERQLTPVGRPKAAFPLPTQFRSIATPSADVKSNGRAAIGTIILARSCPLMFGHWSKSPFCERPKRHSQSVEKKSRLIQAFRSPLVLHLSNVLCRI